MPQKRALRIPISVTLSPKAIRVLDRLITAGRASTRSAAVEIAILTIDECSAPAERSARKEKRT